jgi:hypothetical protein
MMLIVFLLLVQLPRRQLLNRWRGHQAALPMRMSYSSNRKRFHLLLSLWNNQYLSIRVNNIAWICSCSDEGEIDPPPLKKAKTSSNKKTTAAAEEPLLPKETSAAPSPLKGKEIPSTAASLSSAPQGHVSAVMFLISFDDSLYLTSPRAYIQLLAAEYRLKYSFKYINVQFCVMS